MPAMCPVHVSCVMRGLCVQCHAWTLCACCCLCLSIVCFLHTALVGLMCMAHVCLRHLTLAFFNVHVPCPCMPHAHTCHVGIMYRHVPYMPRSHTCTCHVGCKQVCEEANCFSLATANASGKPSVRVLLLKGYDERGFTFFTNYHSRKGRDLAANGVAALCIYWERLQRQVREEAWLSTCRKPLVHVEGEGGEQVP